MRRASEPPSAELLTAERPSAELADDALVAMIAGSSAASELAKDRFAKVGLAEVGAAEVSPAEVGLAELARRYERKVYHFVLGLLRDGHLASDVTAEVFEKVFLKIDLYQTGTNFRAWLFEVARNQALSVLRLHRRMPKPISSLEGATDGGDDPVDWLANIADPSASNRIAEEREFMVAFQNAVAELPENYQRVFELCVQQGNSYDEAAGALRIPVGTVAIRIMRARQRLFRALSRHVDRLRRPPACFQG